MLKGIDAIEGLTPEQITAINGLTTGLLDKNKQLLDKATGVKKDLSARDSEVEALRLFKETADIKAAEDAQNWEEVKRLTEETHKTELEKIMGESSNDKALIQTLLIDNGLSQALDGIDINPALKEGAIAMLKGQCSISDGKAMIGDKTLSEAVKEWSDTDTGKAFSLAPNNSGGDSGGGSNQPVNKKMSEMNGAERTQLFHSDPAKFNAMLAEMKAAK